MEIPKAIIAEMKDAMQKYAITSCKYDFWMFWGWNDLAELRAIGQLRNLEDDFEELQQGKQIWEIPKNVADFEEERVVQLSKEKGEKWRIRKAK